MQRTKKEAIIALSALSVLMCKGSYVVLANENDFVDTLTLDETASTTKSELLVNGENTDWIKPDKSFALSANITVKGDTYKSIIRNALNNLIPRNTSVEVVGIDGLTKLTGELTYSISLPYKLQNTSIAVNCQSDYNSVESVSAVVDTNAQNSTSTITVTATINWGNLLSSYFRANVDACTDWKSFNREEFPDLGIALVMRDLQFDTTVENKEHRPDLGDTAKITGNVKQCTIKSDSSSELSLTYKKKNSNTYYQETEQTTNHISLNETSISVPANPPYATINFSLTRPSTSKPANRPGTVKPNVPSQTGDSNVIRLYNPNTGEHLFTTSEAERINLVYNGWKVEESSWKTPNSSDTPIYRLYNPNHGDHHYTISVAERNTLVDYGWSYEGHSLYSASEEDGIPIYRMYNPNAKGAGSHHYTESIDECTALRSYGWDFEGVAWFGIAK